jgi:hypothetical protein
MISIGPHAITPAQGAARKPRTECCCQSVAVIIAAIVAPAGFCSIAMMRACFVSRLVAGRGDAVADRLRGAGLAALRATERLAAFGLDLAWSWDPLRFARRRPPHHLSPTRQNRPTGLGPKSPPQWLSLYSNAQFAAHCQSIPSNKIARCSLAGPRMCLQAHNLKVTGSNPVPATNDSSKSNASKSWASERTSGFACLRQTAGLRPGLHITITSHSHPDHNRWIFAAVAPSQRRSQDRRQHRTQNMFVGASR